MTKPTTEHDCEFCGGKDTTPMEPNEPFDCWANVPFTKLIGTASIYAITPVSEEVARSLARQYRETPVEIYRPDVQRMLPTSVGTDERPEDDDPDYDY
jgi:hypothetical protein